MFYEVSQMPSCPALYISAMLKLTRAVLIYMQGEAVILAELGEYTRAAFLLEDIIKVSS